MLLQASPPRGISLPEACEEQRDEAIQTASHAGNGDVTWLSNAGDF
jgi:hypothetical protein